MKDKKTIKIISEYRKKNKMTQEKLADELGVSLPTIKRYESDNSLIPKAKVEKLFHIFDIDIDDLKELLKDDTVFLNELEQKALVRDKNKKYEAIISFLRALNYKSDNLGRLLFDKSDIQYFIAPDNKIYFLSNEELKKLSEILSSDIDKFFENANNEELTENELNYFKEKLGNIKNK